MCCFHLVYQFLHDDTGLSLEEDIADTMGQRCPFGVHFNDGGIGSFCYKRQFRGRLDCCGCAHHQQDVALLGDVSGASQVIGGNHFSKKDDVRPVDAATVAARRQGLSNPNP